MRFVYPWTLALLWAPLGLALAGWLLSKTGPAWNPAFVAEPMLSRLGSRPPRLKRLGHTLLVSLGLALAIAACARPQWGRRQIPVVTRNRNVMIVLDVSRSMLAADVHPNRLERARVDLLDLIEAFEGDRAGILAFRHRPTLLCPLTSDVAFLRMTLDGLGAHSAPPGETDIGAALEAALDAFDTATPDHCAIVLISDGEDLGGRALEAARQAGKRGIPIFTVGIGSPEGSRIPIGEDFLTHEGKPVVSRLENDTLAGIASESGGAYIPLATLGTANTTLGDIYRRHLDRIAANETTERIEQRFVDRFPWFLWPGLALLLFSAMTASGTRFSQSRLRAFARSAAPVFLPLAILAAAARPAFGSAPTNAPPRSVSEAFRQVRRADELWKKGDLAGAAREYARAAEALPPERAALARWNSVLAFLRTHRLEQAESASRLLSGNPEFTARVRALRGELYRRQALANAEDAPEEALRRMKAAAEAAQEALLAAGADAEVRALAQDTLALCLEALPRLQREARIARALKEAGDRDIADLLGTLLDKQRALWQSAGEARRAPLPDRIEAFEKAAETQEHLRDLWYPIRKQALSSPLLATNRSLRVEMERAIARAERAMESAAGALRDNAPDAVERTAAPEAILFDFWAGAAPPPALIDQDILLQSNALCRLPPLPLAPENVQPAAERLTALFRERFPEWAAAAAAAEDTAASPAESPRSPPVLDEETRAEILRLAGETTELQRKAAEAVTAGKPAAEWQRPALDRLLRIRDLLPRKTRKNPESPQNKDQDRRKEPPPEPSPPPPPKKPPEQTPETPKPKKSDTQEKLPDRIEDLMRMALERERQHKEEKERETRRIQPRTGIRDW